MLTFVSVIFSLRESDIKSVGLSDIPFAFQTCKANITAKQYNSLQANRVGVVSSGTQRLLLGAYPPATALSQEHGQPRQQRLNKQYRYAELT